MKSKWRVTGGNERETRGTGSLAHYLSGLPHTDRCSSYVDLTRDLWSRVDQKNKLYYYALIIWKKNEFRFAVEPSQFVIHFTAVQ